MLQGALEGECAPRQALVSAHDISLHAQSPNLPLAAIVPDEYERMLPHLEVHPLRDAGDPAGSGRSSRACLFP
jgi:hypothetical protein